MLKELSKPVFKKCIKSNVKYTLDDYKILDESLEFIPLWFKPALFNMYFNKNLMRKFLVVLFDLDESLEFNDIYYGKDIMLEDYPSFVFKTSVMITFGGESFSKSDFLNFDGSLIWNFVRYDEDFSKKDGLYQLVINTGESGDKNLVFKDDDSGIVLDGFRVYVRNIGYYKKLYLRGEHLDKKDLILLIFSISTFSELYEIVSKVFNYEDTLEFMKYAVETSQNSKIIRQFKEHEGERL